MEIFYGVLSALVELAFFCFVGYAFYILDKTLKESIRCRKQREAILREIAYSLYVLSGRQDKDD